MADSDRKFIDVPIPSIDCQIRPLMIKEDQVGLMSRPPKIPSDYVEIEAFGRAFPTIETINGKMKATAFVNKSLSSKDDIWYRQKIGDSAGGQIEYYPSIKPGRYKVVNHMSYDYAPCYSPLSFILCEYKRYDPDKSATSDCLGKSATSDCLGKSVTSDCLGKSVTSDCVGKSATSDCVGKSATSDCVGKSATSDCVKKDQDELVYKDGLEFHYQRDSLQLVLHSVIEYRMGHLIMVINYDSDKFDLIKFISRFKCGRLVSIDTLRDDIAEYCEYSDGALHGNCYSYPTKKNPQLTDLFTSDRLAFPMDLSRRDSVLQEFTVVDRKLIGYFSIGEKRGWTTGRYSISIFQEFKRVYWTMVADLRDPLVQEKPKLWSQDDEHEMTVSCLKEFLASSLPEIWKVVSSYMS